MKEWIKTTWGALPEPFRKMIRWTAVILFAISFLVFLFMQVHSYLTTGGLTDFGFRDLIGL